MSGIRGIREVVGQDGEISYEFASSEESESEASNIDEAMEFAPLRLVRRNALPNLDLADNWGNLDNATLESDIESLPDIEDELPLADARTVEPRPGSREFEGGVTAENLQLIPQTETDVTASNQHPGESENHISIELDNDVQPGPSGRNLFSAAFSLNEDDGTSSSDDSYVPPAEIMSAQNSNHNDPDVGIVPLTNRSGRRRQEPRLLRRRRRNGTKKRRVAKKKEPAPAKPKKALVAATVERNIARLGNLDDFKKKFLNRCPINIPNGGADDNVYKIGTCRLQLVSDFGFNVSFDKGCFQSLFEFPIKVALTFIRDRQANSSNLLLLKHFRPIPETEASELPRPKGKAYQNRPLKFVDVEHYAIHFDILDNLTPEFFDGARGKNIRLDFSAYDNITKIMMLDIVVPSDQILNDHTLDDIPAVLRKPARNFLCHYFGLELPDKLETQEKEDIDWFYGQVEKYHQKETLPQVPFSIQHPSLNPTLRPYQCAAVQWMLYKEGCLNDDKMMHETKLNSVVEAFIKKMSVPVSLADSDGNEILAYFNPYVGYLSWARPTVRSVSTGGILADEMGLGKTVEVLALILLHPCPEIEYSENLQTVESGESHVLLESGTKEDSEDENMDRKRRKRSRNSKPNLASKKRALSPCEFEINHIQLERDKIEEDLQVDTDTSDDDFVPAGKAQIEDLQEHARSKITRIKRTVTVARKSSTDDEPSEIDRSSRKCKAKQEGENSQNLEKKVTTYDRVKVLYDAALSGYQMAKKETPKFHGTFFETSLRKEARFECICGQGIERKQKVLQCTKCLSSQHAACVNFNSSFGLPYLCPHCEVSGPRIRTKATLIVTPATISHQWIKEIQRHVRSQHLRILYYKGVGHHGYFPPIKFTEYDLVITTYNVLAADIAYVDLPHSSSEDGRGFRNAKRYMTTPSSLPSVLWWRVCLDEAQMVEGIATKMAMMANKLACIHRWCITGTPMNKGLEDLYGLLSFLQIEPVCYLDWWNYLVRIPFQNKDKSSLFEFFGHVMWRTGKKNVLSQLGIPPQSQKYHWLCFSPVESHFYKRQFEIASAKIMVKINRLKAANGSSIANTRLASLDRQTLHSLLLPFLELRQACCHPQMVKGNILSLQKAKGTMTMEDILDQLMKKTAIQCIDDHRLVTAAMNGLAGLFMLSSRWREAADMYREVISADKKYEGRFRTDPLQLLHALENLADLLDQNHAEVGIALNDDQLRGKALDIRNKYLEKYSNAVKAAKDIAYPITTLVIELMEKFECIQESWHSIVLQRAAEAGKIHDLIWRIKEDLMHKYSIFKKKNKSSLANRFAEASGLQRVLTEKIVEMEEKRDEVLGELEDMLAQQPDSFVEASICCHLRGQTPSYYNERKDTYRCNLCKYHDNFVEYESVLFSTEDNAKKTRTGRNRQINNFTGEAASELTTEERAILLAREEEELLETTEHVNLNVLLEQRKQTWGDSDVEKVLKMLANFGRLNGCSMKVQNDAANHLKILDNMKKEFKHLRILWRQIFDQVSALDELGQAATRLRIGTGVEDTSNQRLKNTPKGLASGMAERADKIMNIHIVQHHEIDLKIEQFQGECVSGKQSLALHMGQLLYLESLKKNGYGKKGSFNTEDCPICTSSLGHQWSVLNCGHSFCTECVKKMGSKNSATNFLCPLCRLPTCMENVSFIDTTPMEEESDFEPEAGPSGLGQQKQVEVKGSFSTKVEAIVGTLLRLQESHPREKVLIFSEWSEVLQIIADALEQNDILFCDLIASAKKSAHKVIQKFKDREDIQVLLIPLHSGSKGLNLIEATHVFLVEPILNLASEHQAIGRVHRIGQTRPTYVHRFYVRQTIEEQLQDILKTQDVSSDNEGLLTIGNLQSLVSNVQMVNL